MAFAEVEVNDFRAQRVPMPLKLEQYEALQEFSPKEAYVYAVLEKSRSLKGNSVFVVATKGSREIDGVVFFNFVTPMQETKDDIRMFVNFSPEDIVVRYTFPLTDGAINVRVSPREGCFIRSTGATVFQAGPNVLEGYADSLYKFVLPETTKDQLLSSTSLLPAFALLCAKSLLYTYAGAQGKSPVFDVPLVFRRRDTTFQNFDAVEAASRHIRGILPALLDVFRRSKEAEPGAVTGLKSSRVLQTLKTNYAELREDAVRYQGMLLSDVFGEQAKEDVFDLADHQQFNQYLKGVVKNIVAVAEQVRQGSILSKGTFILICTAESICRLAEKRVESKYVTLRLVRRPLNRSNMMEYAASMLFSLLGVMDTFNFSAESVFELLRFFRAQESANSMQQSIVSIKEEVEEVDNRVTEEVTSVRKTADELVDSTRKLDTKTTDLAVKVDNLLEQGGNCEYVDTRFAEVEQRVERNEEHLLNNSRRLAEIENKVDVICSDKDKDGASAFLAGLTWVFVAYAASCVTTSLLAKYCAKRQDTSVGRHHRHSKRGRRT